VILLALCGQAVVPEIKAHRSACSKHNLDLMKNHSLLLDEKIIKVHSSLTHFGLSQFSWLQNIPAPALSRSDWSFAFEFMTSADDA